MIAGKDDKQLGERSIIRPPSIGSSVCCCRTCKNQAKFHFDIKNMTVNRVLVVDIDDHIAALIEEINASPSSSNQTSFIEGFQSMVIDQLMGPFGLSRAMFQDKDGGPVTTLNNFEKGIVATEADEERLAALKQAEMPNQGRKDYDKALDASSALNNSNIDGYSGRELPEGPRTTARDHVVSVSEIERSAKSHLAQSRQERVAMATEKENLVLTTFSLNSSKKDDNLMEWMDRPSSKDPSKTNAEFFDVDRQTAEAAYKKARQTVDSKQDRALLVKQASELTMEASSAAGKLALRRIIGMLLHEVVTGVIADIRYLVKTGFESLEKLAALARKRIEQTWSHVREQWAEYLKEGVGAAITGLLSSLVTVLVNAFVTTVKNVVTMIREAVLSLVRAVRLILAPPKDATGEQIAEAVVKILGASVAACIGIALEEVIAKAMQAIPLLSPFATEMATVIAGILTGALTLFSVLAFDRLRDRIAFRNKALADVHRGQTVNLLQIERSLIAIQGAHVQLHIVKESIGQRFHDTKLSIEDARRRTGIEVAAYRHSVDGLDEVLKDL